MNRGPTPTLILLPMHLSRHSAKSVDTHTETGYKPTPDGTQLITFAPDWRTLSIYRYVGVTRDGTRHASADRIFDQAFRLQQHVTTPDPSILFCPHFCFLFSSDSRFLITADRQTAAAAAAAPSPPPPDTPHSLLTREAYLQAGVAPQQTPELLTEQCTVSRLLLISLSSGRVSDSLEVLLSTSHLRGVSAGLSVWLHGYSLAVLSPLSQTLHLLQISPARDGAGTARLVERYSPIGYFLSYPDYQLFLSHPSHASCPPPDQLYPPHMLSQLQQKVFVCLLRQQLAKRSSDRLLPLYSSWELLREMRVWRIQLLSEDTLLLRYKLTRTPNRTQFHLHNLWVIYCCATQRVAHACYDQLDDTREMLQLCEQQLPPLQDPVRYNPWYSSRSRLLETGGAVVTRDALRQLLDRYPVSTEWPPTPPIWTHASSVSVTSCCLSCSPTGEGTSRTLSDSLTQTTGRTESATAV